MSINLFVKANTYSYWKFLRKRFKLKDVMVIKWIKSLLIPRTRRWVKRFSVWLVGISAANFIKNAPWNPKKRSVAERLQNMHKINMSSPLNLPRIKIFIFKIWKVGQKSRPALPPYGMKSFSGIIKKATNDTAHWSDKRAKGFAWEQGPYFPPGWLRWNREGGEKL